MKKLSVLIVEDEERHIQSARRLENEYDLTIARTYREAIEKLNLVPDVMLTDLFIPWHTKSSHPLYPKLEEAVEPRPLGYPLSLIALGIGIPYIGIVTDTDWRYGIMESTIGDVSGYKSNTRLFVGEDDSLHSRPFRENGLLHRKFCMYACSFQGGEKNWGDLILKLLGKGLEHESELKIESFEGYMPD